MTSPNPPSFSTECNDSNETHVKRGNYCNSVQHHLPSFPVSTSRPQCSDPRSFLSFNQRSHLWSTLDNIKLLNCPQLNTDNSAGEQADVRVAISFCRNVLSKHTKKTHKPDTGFLPKFVLVMRRHNKNAA